ncbi:MAG: hypothetical protein MPK06_07225 [Alphaproteobacteria bacterium]|nr:hypothetical protein [Alphaproteobacteria bacterium]MDA8004352.1 hypothetical protein [Alphaproteobacteria bacterium]MDA8006306.1 hypothetical protein [Alphaproteobacteria bacterium]MDA8013482.1 hypothetical protein [Alphaproteobacteria bacterium]
MSAARVIRRIALAAGIATAAALLLSPSARTQQTIWTFSEENRDGQTPGLFAEAWSDNYIERTRALAFFKCDLDEERGGQVYFAFVPSRRLPAAPPGSQRGEATLFWRVDGEHGGPLRTELSIISETRLQYSASGAAILPIIERLRLGGQRIVFADPRVPGGGVTDAFSLAGATGTGGAVSRVQDGCDNFTPRRAVIPDSARGLELDGTSETDPLLPETDTANTDQNNDQ